MASRSLGTLTLDLIAKVGGYERGLDKAERATARRTAQMKKGFADVGKAIAALGAAGTAGLVKVTTEVVKSAREIENLSRVANTSTDDFQRIAFAAQRYGIEQEKVADILKDTSDKIGDFLITGGGPLKDFFEEVAPQIGVTADQFRNLSGDQALGLYVKSLEQANLSQSELTFFLEAIASDASALLPILSDNASELNRLGDQAEEFGAIINQVELDRLTDVRDQIDDLKGVFKGLSTEVALSTVPALQELIQVLSSEATLSAAKALAQALVTGFEAATKAISATLNVTKFLSESLAAAVSGPAVGDLVRLNERLDELIVKRERLVRGGITRREAKILPGVDEEIERIRTLISFTEDLQRTVEEPSSPGAPPIAEAPAQTLSRPRIGSSFREADEAANDDIQRLNEQAERIRESLLSEEQSIEESFQRRRDIILRNTEITGKARQELLEKLENDTTARLQEIEGRRQVVLLSAAEGVFGSLADLSKQFLGEQSGVFKALFAIEKAAAIARSIVAIQTGLAQAAAIPFPANLGAIATVASATAGIISTIQSTNLQGVAHDGLDSVPTTGTYLLERGERVTTAETSEKLDRKLDAIPDNPNMGNGQQNIRIVNAFDTSIISDFNSTREGELSIMNIVKNNQKTIRDLAATA